MIARTGNVTTFARMTPKMSAALVAAEACHERGGLCYTVAGWIDPGDCFKHHGPVVVSRLVWNHGYLARIGADGSAHSRRVITTKGRAWLAHARREGWIKKGGAA